MILQTIILFVDLFGVRATEKENVIVMSSVVFITLHHLDLYPKRIEYILEWNLLDKSVKRPFCCTVAILQVLHIFVLYNLLGPGTSFYRKSKINIKRKPNYEIGWFHNWPMIISHRLYAFHFTNDDFSL